MSRAADLLGATGPFATRLPRYEARPGQLDMASGVERALLEDRVFICEAGTGTGKTLAYLVPAVLSGRKVLVSTATRALQEQIFDKDLPLVAEALGVNPRAALVKGLGNYLCLRRYHQARVSPEASRPSVARTLGLVESWVGDTETGDLAELAALGEDDPVLAMVASSSDTRVGSGCQHHAECFITRMRRDAEEARLLVVNHHLFFADLALRGPHPGRVLPDYDAVIFDEAHHLEDVATTFFGVRVSVGRVTHLLREIERAAHGGRGPLMAGAGPVGVLEAARSASIGFFDMVARHARDAEGRARLDRDFWNGEAEARYLALDGALDGVSGLVQTLRSKVSASAATLPRREAIALTDAFDVAERRTQATRDDLAMIVQGARGRITWVEVTGESTAIGSAPVDVSEILRTRLFETVPSVVLTSATLASGGDPQEPFGYVKTRLGLATPGAPESEGLVVPSPFDYATRSLLYVPDDLPEPSSPDFLVRAVERIIQLVEMTEGGVFVLTTSVRSMRSLHRALAGRLTGRRVLVQGSAPKAALLAAFRADGRAILVATTSFWQGVDVPGRALRLVVLDKLPFPVPSDPVVRARGEELEERGGNAFFDLSVPIAQIALKQGFGRLVRSGEDDGVVALLDSRVHRRGYGRRMLDGLPPAPRTRELEDVRRFWSKLAASTGANR